MTEPTRRAFAMRAVATGLLPLAAMGAAGAAAQTAPPAKIIVGNPAGGTTDLFARVVAQAVQQRTGQTVTVDNRPGAGGLIGLQALLAAPADGNTLLLASLSQLAAPALQKPRIEVLAEIEPVAMLASGGSLLLVKAGSPIGDLASFIQHAKQNPGKLMYSSAGQGTTGHMFMEYLKGQLGIDLVHVPYKGGPSQVRAIMAGEVDATIIDEANAAPVIQDGKARAIAQTGLLPLDSFPRLPRVADRAPGFDATFWMGLVMRKGTKPEVVDRWSQLISSAVQNELKDPIRRAGLHAAAPTAKVFAEHLARENDKWLAVIRAGNITAD